MSERWSTSFPSTCSGRHVLRRPDHHPGARDPLALERPGDPEVHDPGVPVLVDEDVAGLQVPMDDSQPVGFFQALADLPGDRHRFPGRQASHLPDQTPEVLPGDVFHGDKVRPRILHELVHLADVPVGDLPGQLELVVEPFDRLLVGGDLRPDELEGDFLIELLVENPVDLAHAAVAQFLDDLVAAGEGRARGQFFKRCLKGLRLKQG